MTALLAILQSRKFTKLISANADQRKYQRREKNIMITFQFKLHIKSACHIFVILPDNKETVLTEAFHFVIWKFYLCCDLLSHVLTKN